MNCKLTNALLLLCVCGIVLQTEAIIFTLGGIVLDSALAVKIFHKFLHCTTWIGKRSVDSMIPQVSSLGSSATAEQYLSVAASIDTNRCLPVVVCAAMARSRDVSTKLSELDTLVVQTFSGRLDDQLGAIPSPIDYYREAAKYGEAVGSPEQCGKISQSCNYSVDELYRMTLAVSQ